MKSFSSSFPTIMHIDLNSCFASVEQQANPLLRGRPTVVAAYTTGNGCILAASREAKRLGINTGMSVRDGQMIYPKLAILPPDPQKYRFVNKAMQKILGSYTPYFSVQSIDEMVMDLHNSPKLTLTDSGNQYIKTHQKICVKAMIVIGQDIKLRIKKEIGDWLTVSIGIAPNRYLAKVASGLHKPDGMDSITKETIEEVFRVMKLEDLCGIKDGNARRLRWAGIPTPVALYHASPELLVQAFHSKVGWYWWQRLHGFEDGQLYKNFDAAQDLQKTFGQSFAFGSMRVAHDPQVGKILTQLIVKMGRRLRGEGYVAGGFTVSLYFRDHTHWGKNYLSAMPLFADNDFVHIGRSLLVHAPQKSIRILAVTSFALTRTGTGQLFLWDEETKKRNVTKALDQIADRFGEFMVTPGTMLGMEQKVLDRIAFGGGRSLQNEH